MFQGATESNNEAKQDIAVERERNYEDRDEMFKDEEANNAAKKKDDFPNRKEDFPKKKNLFDDGVEKKDKKNCSRMEDNVDEIASTIMSMIDAVDKDNENKIKSICITIGLD